MTRRNLRIMTGVVLTAACSIHFGCHSVQRIDVTPESTGASLYPGLDAYHRPISTSSPEAQRWFDQGIQLAYGFNHDEAIRCFKEAAARDPEAPMPWWGVAYCYGMNINDPEMTREKYREAWNAVQQARMRLAGASPVEAALIEAVSVRYDWPAPRNQRKYDEAYARAMEQVWEEFPNDPDVGVYYAESLMNLQPWDYWTDDGEPKGRIEDAVAAIEQVLAMQPDHPGAMHFYIHAMEASARPESAELAADMLRNRVPGSGHLVHMPSHIYVRVGRWDDAADANVRAVAADRRYFETAPPPDMYGAYYAHNLHFLAYSSMMEGRYEVAIQAARDLEAEMPEEVIREHASFIEGVMPTTYHVLVRFGRWEDILREPQRADYRLVSRAVHHYARGIALSALGRTEEAEREVELFDKAAAEIPGDWWIFNNKVDVVLPIARNMLLGELAFREGRYEEAFSLLREAVAMEDALVYDEPPAWMLPIRHALGALLMSAGRYEEAEQVYREDLRHNRKNGWALLGLELALRAQQDSSLNEILEISAERNRAWARADVQPTSSCFCEPGVAMR